MVLSIFITRTCQSLYCHQNSSALNSTCDPAKTDTKDITNIPSGLSGKHPVIHPLLLGQYLMPQRRIGLINCKLFFQNLFRKLAFYRWQLDTSFFSFLSFKSLFNFTNVLYIARQKQ